MVSLSYSIVEYLGKSSSNKCGYCRGNSGNKESCGFWAHNLNIEDFEKLTYRNWRRSGKYCYHPVMDRTCCPQYMIQCDTDKFKISKHQKKIFKRVNRYLMTGSTSAEAKAADLKLNEASKQQTKESSTAATSAAKKEVRPGEGADPNKPKAIKAKILRQLRKTEKQQAATSSAEMKSKTQTDDSGKSLSDLVNEYDISCAKYKLELRLVKSNPPSAEFQSTLHEEHAVYKKYQMAIHGDPEEKCTMSQFTRFLVDSPLQSESRNGFELGSYHCQYVLDGRVVAVEVMDITSIFVSSVYFFYDPDYDFLNLGTYSALRSIQLLQDFKQKLPTLRHYLMGYYIHSCVKMRYKGQFSESYLICPETYEWVPIEICVPKLNVNKYSRLTDDVDKSVAAPFSPHAIIKFTVDPDLPNSSDYGDTLCLHRRQIYTYTQLSQKRKAAHDLEEVKAYGNLVGKRLMHSLLLYRE